MDFFERFGHDCAMFFPRAAAVVSVVALAIPALAVPGGGAASSASIDGNATALVLGEVAASSAQRRDSPFAVGDLFPDLAFPSLEGGTPTRLSDFRGKKVMLQCCLIAIAH